MQIIYSHGVWTILQDGSDPEDIWAALIQAEKSVLAMRGERIEQEEKKQELEQVQIEKAARMKRVVTKSSITGAHKRKKSACALCGKRVLWMYHHLKSNHGQVQTEAVESEPMEPEQDASVGGVGLVAISDTV